MNKMKRPSLVISTAEVDAAAARLAPRAPAASPATVLAIVCVGICLANLDLFIVNVALPNIGRDFRDAPLEDMSWVLNGYAIGGLAAALGPVIGGVLVTVNWRWIFLVNVPIGLVAMLVGWWKLPEVPGHEAPRPHPFDALLVSGGIGALTFAIVKVNDWGWRSTGIGISFVAAIVLLAWFVWRCLRSDSPFVDPALFRIRQFTGAALGMAPYSAAFGAMLLSAALW